MPLNYLVLLRVLLLQQPKKANARNLAASSLERGIEH